jgi:hypothetical protein
MNHFSHSTQDSTLLCFSARLALADLHSEIIWHRVALDITRAYHPESIAPLYRVSISTGLITKIESLKWSI